MNVRRWKSFTSLLSGCRGRRDNVPPLPDAFLGTTHSREAMNGAVEWMDERFREHHLDPEGRICRDGHEVRPFSETALESLRGAPPEVWLLSLGGRAWVQLHENRFEPWRFVGHLIAFLGVALILTMGVLGLSGDWNMFLVGLESGKGLPVEWPQIDIDGTSSALSLAAVWATLAAVEFGAETIRADESRTRNELKHQGSKQVDVQSTFQTGHFAIALVSWVLMLLVLAKFIYALARDEIIHHASSEILGVILLFIVGFASFAYQDNFDRFPALKQQRDKREKEKIIEAAVFFQRHRTRRPDWRRALPELMTPSLLLVAAILVVWLLPAIDRGSKSMPALLIVAGLLGAAAFPLSVLYTVLRWRWCWPARAKKVHGLESFDARSANGLVAELIGFVIFVILFVIASLCVFWGRGEQSWTADAFLLVLFAPLATVCAFLGVVELVIRFGLSNTALCWQGQIRYARNVLRLQKKYSS